MLVSQDLHALYRHHIVYLWFFNYTVGQVGEMNRYPGNQTPLFNFNKPQVKFLHGHTWIIASVKLLGVLVWPCSLWAAKHAEPGIDQ